MSVETGLDASLSFLSTSRRCSRNQLELGGARFDPAC